MVNVCERDRCSDEDEDDDGPNVDEGGGMSDGSNNTPSLPAPAPPRESCIDSCIAEVAASLFPTTLLATDEESTNGRLWL